MSSAEAGAKITNGMHSDNKTERFIPIPSMVVRNCTETPTVMGAALQFGGEPGMSGHGVADPIAACDMSIDHNGLAKCGATRLACRVQPTTPCTRSAALTNPQAEATLTLGTILLISRVGLIR